MWWCVRPHLMVLNEKVIQQNSGSSPMRIPPTHILQAFHFEEEEKLHLIITKITDDKNHLLTFWRLYFTSLVELIFQSRRRIFINFRFLLNDDNEVSTLTDSIYFCPFSLFNWLIYVFVQQQKQQKQKHRQIKKFIKRPTDEMILVWHGMAFAEGKAIWYNEYDKDENNSTTS